MGLKYRTTQLLVTGPEVDQQIQQSRLFEERISNGLVFKGSGYSFSYRYGPSHWKTRPFKIWTFKSRFQIAFDKMAHIYLDFKCLGYRISDPIQDLDQPLFHHLKCRLVPISDPHCIDAQTQQDRQLHRGLKPCTKVDQDEGASPTPCYLFCLLLTLPGQTNFTKIKCLLNSSSLVSHIIILDDKKQKNERVAATAVVVAALVLGIANAVGQDCKDSFSLWQTGRIVNLANSLLTPTLSQVQSETKSFTKNWQQLQFNTVLRDHYVWSSLTYVRCRFKVSALFGLRHSHSVTSSVVL